MRRHQGRKVFLIIDNGPCHHLDDDGKRWLRKNRRLIELHHAFFVTPGQRDAKLTETFNVFHRRPEVIAAHVARFR